MKKLLALLAIVSVAANASPMKDVKDAGKAVSEYHQDKSYPERILIAPVGIPVGTALMWTADNVDNAVDTAVGLYNDLKQAGRCSMKAEHPGQLAGCILVAPTDMAITIIDGGATLARTTVNYGVGQLLGGLNEEVRRASETAKKNLQKQGLAGEVLAIPFVVVEFVADVSGTVIESSRVSVVYLVDAGASGAGETLKRSGKAVAYILDLQPKKSLENVGMAIHAGLCTVIATPIEAAAKFIAGLFNKKFEQSCIREAKEIFRAIDAGTYEYPTTQPDPHGGA